MIVCICNRVSDSRIRACVEGGARSLREVREALDVATVCGTCAPCVRDLVRQCLEAQRDRAHSTAA